MITMIATYFFRQSRNNLAIIQKPGLKIVPVLPPTELSLTIIIAYFKMFLKIKFQEAV